MMRAWALAVLLLLGAGAAEAQQGDLLERATAGEIQAQYEYGLAALSGRQGVARDSKVAVDWFTKAARGGHSKSMLTLGLVYQQGLGVDVDVRAGAQWTERAAKAGIIQARLLTGRLYREGTGFIKDTVQAHMWLNLAAASGLSEAADERDTLETEMSPRGREEAQAMAREQVARDAELGAAR